MARRHEGGQAIAEERLGDHVRVGPDETADAEVHLVALDEVDEARGDGVADADDDPVVGPRQRGDGLRQDAGGDRRQGADRDRAPLVRREVARVLDDGGDVGRDALERGDQVAPGLRQRDPPVVAIEEPHAERGLELPDLDGERRLRQVQRRRGPGEVPEPGHGQERLDVPQLRRSLRRFEHCDANDSFYRRPAAREDAGVPLTSGSMSLALLGLLTIVSVLAAIMSRRVTPLVALIALPTLAALLGGFGLQTGTFAIAGIKETAPVAAMFVFAILFFGVMTDAGLLDPIVAGVLRAVGLHPTRIVVGSALLALVAHLDGSGAVTFLVTVPAVLPLYDRLGLDRRVLACVVSLAAGVNFLPWTGPVLRASAALQIPTATLFAPLIPVQAVGLVFVFTVAWYLGRREGRRLAASLDGRGRGRRRAARAHRGRAGAAAARTLPDQPAADAGRDGHDAERPRSIRRSSSCWRPPSRCWSTIPTPRRSGTGSTRTRGRR